MTEVFGVGFKTMKLPIIIAEPGTIDLYKSIYDAENNLEAIDVRNNIFVGYDAGGDLLEFKIIENKVVINKTDPVMNKSMELENLLRDQLRAVGKDIEKIPPGEIPKLLEAAKGFYVIIPENSWVMIKSFFKDLINTILRRPLR